MLCVAGGALGTAAAAWGLRAITGWTRAHMEANLAFWWVWQADAVTFLSAGLFLIVAIAVLGIVVAMRAMRTNVREVLQDSSARAGSRREGRLSRLLVATQVATVTILMFVGVLAGVMAKRVVALDPGYDPTGVLQSALEPPTDRFHTDTSRAALYRTVQARLAERATFEHTLLRTHLARAGDEAGGYALRSALDAVPPPPVNILATLGNLSTLGVSLETGRLFTASDDITSAPVMMVSRALAQRQWQGASPVGDQIRLRGVGNTEEWYTIVGVVSDIPYGDPLARDRSTEAIYLPLLQTGSPSANIFVRVNGSEVAARAALHETLGSIDPMLIPNSVYRAAEVIEKSGLIATGLAKLLGGCFAFALLLAVAGTYGLMSQAILQRTREIGVRRALGATDRQTVTMLLAQGARQLGVGTLAAAPVIVVVGVAATRLLPLSRALAITTGVAVSLSVILVVLAATWLPTRAVIRVGLRDALVRD